MVDLCTVNDLCLDLSGDYIGINFGSMCTNSLNCTLEINELYTCDCTTALCKSVYHEIKKKSSGI